MTIPRYPEKSKKPGVHYAVTSDGVELPIIDVTHPAFASSVTNAEQHAEVEQYLRQGQPFAMLPRRARELVLRLLLRGSILANGIRRSNGTFLSGMSTYLLKLGPDNLGHSYAKPIDRRIAASLPARAIAWRLNDVARLLADALAPALASDASRPIHFVNIAGGPAMDSLNALLLLHREHPSALSGRRVVIDVLDRDIEGPTFGARALRAMQEPGAPLAGLDVSFRHTRYDWTAVAPLEDVLRSARAEHAWMVGSSEGGLFEYGSDDEILKNLAALRAGTPRGFVFAGSVTRADRPARRLHQLGGAAVRPRGLAVFRDLVAREGWRVIRAIERPFSDHVALTHE